MKRNWKERLRRLVIRAAVGLGTFAPAAFASEPPVRTTAGYTWEKQRVAGEHRTYFTEPSSGVSVLVGPPAIAYKDLQGFCASRSDLFHSFRPLRAEDAELLEALEVRESTQALVGRRFWLVPAAGSGFATSTIYNGTTGVVTTNKEESLNEAPLRFAAFCISYDGSNVFVP